MSVSLRALLLVTCLSSLHTVHGLSCYCTIDECTTASTWPTDVCKPTPPESMYEKNLPKMKKRLAEAMADWPTSGADLTQKLDSQTPQTILEMSLGLVFMSNERRRLLRLGQSEEDAEKGVQWKKDELLNMKVTMVDGYYDQFCLKMLEPHGSVSKGCGHYMTQMTGLRYAEGCHRQADPRAESVADGDDLKEDVPYCRCSTDKCNWGEVTGYEPDVSYNLTAVEARSSAPNRQVSVGRMLLLGLMAATMKTVLLV